MEIRLREDYDVVAAYNVLLYESRRGFKENI